MEVVLVADAEVMVSLAVGLGRWSFLDLSLTEELLPELRFESGSLAGTITKKRYRPRCSRYTDYAKVRTASR